MLGVSAATVRETISRWVTTGRFPLVVDLARSHGSYLRDVESGTEYLDFFSFASTRPLGYNDEALLDPPFLERLKRVAVHKPSNCDIFTQEYADFVDSFARVACEERFRHFFFVEGGSSAVENALKAAIDWKHRKNLDAGRGTKGTQIVHFSHCFHGRTGYALSLTDSYDERKTPFYPTLDWPRISSPVMSFPFSPAALGAVEEAEAKATEQIHAAFEKHADDVAAIIIEPIQGEGGDNYFRSEFLRELRTICDQREALLIFDEVQTGFGATGRWWDWLHHDVRPDLMVFGSKTQVSGVAATERLDEVESIFLSPSGISSTFSGNLTDMVRCQRIIETITGRGLVDNAATMGKYLLRVLNDIAESHEEVTGVRGRGLWAAFDLPNTERRDKLVKACFDEQLLLMPAGERSVRMRPALDVNADAIGRAAAQLEAGLRRAQGRRG